MAASHNPSSDRCLIVWQRSNTGGTGDDLYGRRLWADGRPADGEPAFALVEAAGDQQRPAVAGDGRGGYLTAWQDECEAYQERSGWYRNGDWDIYATTLQDERRVIAYEYDGLYRLTEANYSTGEKFAYDYDPVGNREAMTVTTPLSGTEVTTYTYDAANRLTYVGGVALTWDNNGNLLEDHEGTEYAYDTANRLIQVVQNGVTYTFAYNGTGDRLSQSVGGAVTTYTLDLYGGLTQVLGDGASVYLYGLGRVGEEGAAGWLYHLGDALGSVRQLAAGDGEVVLDRSYRPYGGVLESGGSGASAYGFAGEWTDGTGLVFLRARYMDPRVGRLLTMDPRSGVASYPRTLHRYMYGDSDPINKVDPSGLSSQPPPPWGMTPVEDIPAWVAVQMARLLYHKSGIHELGVCTMVDPEVQLPSDTLNDIFIDYVCEFGPQHRHFNADCHLTRQLARSFTVHNLRRDFYRSRFQFIPDRANGYKLYQFGGVEFGYATIDSLMASDRTRFVVPVSINVTHYLGSFEYKIVRLGDRVVFEIRDQKDRASGTRIAAFDETAPQYSVEVLIEQNPGLRTAGLASIIANNNVVSILEARERDPASAMGGGAMEMTFTWCEPLPLIGCTNWLPPWPAVVPLLQIRDCAGGGGGAGFGG